MSIAAVGELLGSWGAEQFEKDRDVYSQWTIRLVRHPLYLYSLSKGGFIVAAGPWLRGLLVGLSVGLRCARR